MFLKKIHGYSQGLIVKIFLGILCASFGLWGIAEVIQKYLAYRPIAKVGRFEITYDELSNLLNQETNRIQQMYNGKIDQQVLRKLQLHTIVIERLINQKALTQLLEYFRFSASDALVGDIIKNQPAFKKDGFYDATLLRELLRTNGISETNFINQMREDIFRNQLIGTLQSITILPKISVDIITDALTTKHTFSALTIPLTSIHLEKTATEEDLKVFFEQNKDRYKTPEYRKAQVIIFDKNVLSKNIKVSQEEITEQYNNTLADYTQPERRMVKRATYPNHDAAILALESLKKGRLLTAVTRDIPGGKYDDIGLVEKTELPEDVRDTVFSLQTGKYSDPIENGASYSIYVVTRIDPETVKSLNEVRVKVEEDVRAQKYPDYFQDLRNTFDDDLASGLKLSDAAAKHGLNAINLSKFNYNGQNIDKSDALKSLPEDAKLAVLEQTFALEEGKDSLITDISDTHAFIVHLEKITPVAFPDFESIKDKLKKDWERDQKLSSAAKLATSLTENAKNLTELKENAKNKGFSHSESHSIRRVDVELKDFKETKSGKFFTSLTPQLMQKIFTLTIGKSTFDVTADDKVIILMLQGTEPDNMDKTTIEKIKLSIGKMAQEDILPLVTLAARNRIDVKINEELMRLISRSIADGD